MTAPVPVEQQIARLLSDVYTGKGVDIWMNAHNFNLRATPRALLAAGDTEAVLAEARRVGRLFR